MPGRGSCPDLQHAGALKLNVMHIQYCFEGTKFGDYSKWQHVFNNSAIFLFPCHDFAARALGGGSLPL
jgi:hypothetical protein